MTNTVAGIVIPAGVDPFEPVDPSGGTNSDLAAMAQSMGNLAGQTKADALTAAGAYTDTKAASTLNSAKAYSDANAATLNDRIDGLGAIAALSPNEVQTMVDASANAQSAADSAAASAALVGAPADPIMAAAAGSSASLTGAAIDARLVGSDDLADDYVYVREDMNVSVVGQDSSGKLYGVSTANGHYVTSTDNTATWTDRTYSASTYTLGILEIIFAGSYMYANCNNGKIYRAPKDVFNGWVDITPSDVPAGTTGRPGNLSTDGTILMYGNYNAATYSPGFADYPRVWRCDDPTVATPTWTIVLSVTDGRHVHSVTTDPRTPGAWYVAIGDSPIPGMGLYRSSDGSAGSFTRLGSNRYPINIKYPPAPVAKGDPDWILGEGDGMNQPHLIGMRRTYVGAGGGPLEGMAWPTTEWRGTVRGLHVDSNGDAFYISTAEGGTVGTKEGIWAARGPHYSDPVLLEDMGTTPFAGYLATYESGDWMINQRWRMRKPRWKSRIVPKTSAFAPSPVRTTEGVQAPIPARVSATTAPYDYPMGTTTGIATGWTIDGVAFSGVLTTYRYSSGAVQTINSINTSTDLPPTAYTRASYTSGGQQTWGTWRRIVGGIEGATATLATTQTITQAAQNTLTLAGVKLSLPTTVTWITGGGITIPAGFAGYYSVSAKISWASPAAASGYRELNVNKNGVSIALARSAGSTSPITMTSGTGAILLAAGDALTVSAFQTSGQNLDATAGSTNTFLEVQRVSAT